jgi:hypothetical protein
MSTQEKWLSVTAELLMKNEVGTAMRRISLIAVSLAGLVFTVALLSPPHIPAQQPDDSQSRIQQGFAVAPVLLNLHGKNRALVGLGSYIVNAQGGCNDCHTCPSYAPGHNPFEGGDGQINATNYLAGGVPFGPTLKSANLTPNADGKPEGKTFEEFLDLMRTGHDPEDRHILQVMPWAIYRNMNNKDLRAVYEYLSAIPPAEPGVCLAPGQ